MLSQTGLEFSPQSDAEREEEDDDCRGDEGPGDTAETGQGLNTEEVEAPAVQEPVVGDVALQVVFPGCQPDSHHAPEPADPVDSAGTDRVVHPGPDQEAGGEDDQETSDSSGDHGRQVGHHGLNTHSSNSRERGGERGTYTAGHDAHQTPQDPVTSQHHVSLPLLSDEAVAETNQAATEGGQDGGDCSLYCQDPSLPTDPKG